VTALLQPDLLDADEEAGNDGHNRERTLRWRDFCALYMRTAGGLPVGPPVHLAGAWSDSGEIDGLPDWTILARRQKRLALPASVDAALQRAANDGKKYAAVVLHRRMRDVQDAYVVIPFGQFTQLLADARPHRQEKKP
jgi:hypothetical protein